MRHDTIGDAGTSDGVEEGRALAIFAAHRDRLWGIAYGILGSPEDADDLVQDAYLRWHRTDNAAVREPEAWLVATTTRLGIDRLRARQSERRMYVGAWLPAPLVDPSTRTDRAAEIASELSVAFLVLMERLAPEERAAFLLREVFDVGYPEISRVLNRNETACRQVVRRARMRVRTDAPRFQPPAEEIESMARRFSAALEADDYSAVLELLSPDASYTADSGGKARAARNVVRSADRVARCVLGVAKKRRLAGGIEERLTRVNGEPGILTFQHGQVIAATMFALKNGRIHRIYRVVNPEKLSAIPSLSVIDGRQGRDRTPVDPSAD